MGRSASAGLCFGFDLGDEDSEESLINKLKAKNEDEDEEFDIYQFEKQLEAIGCELVSYGEYEPYPYFIAIKGSFPTENRYDSSFMVPALPVKNDEWEATLKKASEILGVEIPETGWFIYSCVM